MNSFLNCPVDPHSGKTVKVKTQTLNSFIDSLDVDRVGFVKMDIEGFENEVSLNLHLKMPSQKSMDFMLRFMTLQDLDLCRVWM